MSNTFINLRSAAIAIASGALFALGTGSVAFADGHGHGNHGGGQGSGRGEQRAPGHVFAPQRVSVRHQVAAPQGYRRAKHDPSYRQAYAAPVRVQRYARNENRARVQHYAARTKYRNYGAVVSHVWAPTRKQHGKTNLYGAPAYYATQAYRNAQAYYNPGVYYNNPAVYYSNPSVYYNAPAQTYYNLNYYGNSASYSPLNPIDSILGSLLGGGTTGLGSIFGAGNNGNIASILVPIAIGAILNNGSGQNGLGSILNGGIPASFAQPAGYSQPVNYAPQQSISGTVLSASGSSFTMLTANNQKILVNDSSTQFNMPVSIGQWVTISGYSSGNQFVVTSIN
jgi:hypothetical protein